MNTITIVAILGIVIGGSVVFGLTYKFPVDSDDKIGFESPYREEHYEIQITGIKDVYLLGEKYDFSYIISGYGFLCGGKTVTFPDQNGDTVGTRSSASCIADIPMKDFVFDIQKERGTTYGHIIIKNPGTYNVTITFDRPSSDFPTKSVKEFQVVDYKSNTDISNELKVVLDSCVNESPQERIEHPLRYTNETHVFLNLGCEWKKIGKFVSESDPETESDSNFVPKWKIPEELSKIGCTDAMVDHLKKYSNAFDEKWHGEGVAIEDIGLPWGVHKYALDQCMQNISELRDSELYGCKENEVYFRGICMTSETKEKTQSIGEKENKN